MNARQRMALRVAHGAEHAAREIAREDSRQRAAAATHRFLLRATTIPFIVGFGLILWQVTRPAPIPVVILLGMLLTIPFLAEMTKR